MAGVGERASGNVHQNEYLVNFCTAKSAILTARNTSIANTYVVEPSQSISLGVGSNVALEINIISFFDIVWVQT